MSASTSVSLLIAGDLNPQEAIIRWIVLNPHEATTISEPDGKKLIDFLNIRDLQLVLQRLKLTLILGSPGLYDNPSVAKLGGSDVNRIKNAMTIFNARLEMLQKARVEE